MGTFEGAVADIEGVITGIAGPPGSGKTGVLLRLLALGARPVAFERLVPDGTPGTADNIRIRARHLHLLGPSVELRRSERARLRAGRLAMRLPVLGPKVGRRCFVDLPPDAIRGWAPSSRIALVVVLDPSSSDRTAAPDRGGELRGTPVLRIGTAGREPDELAQQIRDLAVRSRC